MAKMIKSIFISAVLAVVILFAGYIALLAYIEGGITKDITRSVDIRQEDTYLRLPWYYRIGAEFWAKSEGTDAEGNMYTKYYYDLPDILEDSTMECIIAWNEPRVMLYICESRGIEFLMSEFDHVEWGPLTGTDD